jgi:hypothetical protein
MYFGIKNILKNNRISKQTYEMILIKKKKITAKLD